MYCYEGTNITGEKAVKDARTQLNDALIESYGSLERKWQPDVNRRCLLEE